MTTLPPGPPQPDEPDLDYGDADDPDPNADAPLIEAPRYVRTEVAPHASPPGQMDAMWDALRAFRAAKHRKIEAGGGVADFLWEVPPAPRGAKVLAQRLRDAGWRVIETATGVEIAPLLFVGSSDTHDAGDVRTPGHLQYHWSVRAVLRRSETTVAWCWATWERREVGAKPGNKFLDALTWDVVTWKDPEGLGTGRGYETTAGGFESWVSIFAPKR